MAFSIAITGKGGVGKTTVAGIAIARLIARGCAPVLAVDADPNVCLDQTLGLRVGKTIGGVREEARQIAGKGLAAGVSKQQLLELKIAESLVEADGFDLIAMGRPEGPGCYCYANNVLREAIKQIAASYPFVVIDNEAGLENLSRRIVQHVDLMVMVADPSQRGLATVGRLFDLAREMETKFDRLAIVVNRLRNGRLPDGAEALRAKTQANYILGLPDDAELADLAEAGGDVRSLAATNPVVAKIDAFLSQAVSDQLSAVSQNTRASS
ncbi:MAG: AAA family ATPase [Phycisphaerae bacterium]|nr:AAA family ATPase [Phycisphaerae bacterium]